jgi:hypothetical protein
MEETENVGEMDVEVEVDEMVEIDVVVVIAEIGNIVL